MSNHLQINPSSFSTISVVRHSGDVKHRILVTARLDINTFEELHDANYVTERLQEIAETFEWGTRTDDEYYGKFQFACRLLRQASALELPESTFIPELTDVDLDMSCIELKRSDLQKILDDEDIKRVTLTGLNFNYKTNQKLQIDIID
jgi:hypothetical protein